MAKSFKSSLPKVISKANREISTIIENDINKESELLKNLVDQVLAANMEVKKQNNLRVTETRRKLQELDIEIDELNKSIDLVDRETVLEQLNEMIDAENKIFAARQEIRFFENDQVGDKLEQLNQIYNNLESSIFITRKLEDTYQHILSSSNDMLFDKQISLTTEVIQLMETLYDEKRIFTGQQIDETNDIKARIMQLENDFNTYMQEHIERDINIHHESTSSFTEIDDEIQLGEKITQNHIETMQSINEKIELITSKYTEKKEQTIATYKEFETATRQKLELQNKQELELERQELRKKEEELKNIRLLIIDAEKKQNFTKVQALMKQFDKLEKTKVANVTDKTDKILIQETKKAKEKAIKQLQALNHKHVVDLNKQELALQLETIKFEEAKILYKIKADHLALIGDMQINKRRLQNIQQFFEEKRRVTTEINHLKLNLRIAELEIMKSNELRDNSFIEQFKTLLQDLKSIEHKRLLTLQEHVSNHELIKIEQQYHIGKTVLDLKLSKELSDIDKLILKTRNESLIKIEKMKEDANSEIIYQESLIKIAQKERELQLVKVHSLYGNERSLAEEQVERINLGIQVNDAFVKTTFQNQLLFAQQQIKCAESEFEIRVENINLTKEQELAYANKKIDYYRQKYEYEKSKINKELDDKLEDLNFKLLLFTDKKENASIQQQIDVLRERYQKMIQEIEDQEQQDEQIKRYETVIQATETRANQAISEAVALRDQTTDAFETLYDQTRLKYDQIETTNHSQDTVGIMPLLNSGAISSADERLQRAIKEAEELYEDRVLKPNQIILQTKETLLEMTKDEETERFIQQQKDLKHKKIQEHAELLDELHQDREQALLSATDEVERAKIIQAKELEQDQEELYNTPLYRTEEVINKDYVILFEKERQYHLEKIKKVDDYIKDELVEHTKILKETQQWIKSTIKPYKKFIRKATTGLNAEKRELIRKNKRILKKALNETDDNFTTSL